MRDDMFEIIIERPRRGSRWMKHARRADRTDPNVDVRRDPDAMLKQIGVAKWARMGRNWKSLNENLAPLRRYLESQVNRPWDKVWSDLTANLSTGSTVQQHVRDHVDDFVAYRTYARDGIVYATPRFGSARPISESWQRLYVDPRTGILRRNKHYGSWTSKMRKKREAETAERAARMREVSPDTQLHKFEDRGWWEVKLAPIPRVRVATSYGHRRYYETYEAVIDVVYAAKLSELPPDELYGRHGVYAMGKRQLSKKEGAALKLPEEPARPIPQPAR